MFNTKIESDLSLVTTSSLIAFAVFGGGILMAVLTSPEDVSFVKDKDNHCRLIEKVQTDKRLYCGKACTTPEYKHTFQCADGKTRIVFYFDLE